MVSVPDAEDKVQPATIADLLAKPVREKIVIVEVAPGERRSLRLRAIGRPAFDALVARHPARRDDPADLLNEWGQLKRWHVATFYPALVAASLAEPALSEEEVGQFWERWSRGDTEQLAQAAYDVNEGETAVVLGESSAVSTETASSDD